MKINELNVKQMVAALAFYNTAQSVDRDHVSFTLFLAKCDIANDHGGENSGIIYHSDDNINVYIKHGFWWLSESEEAQIIEHLKNLLISE